ncbi:MAG TPA: radical SAM protein [Phycisphaerae bacterium]|nr:radical SAM protein [Phycisphaerae bacterium]
MPSSISTTAAPAHELVTSVDELRKILTNMSDQRAQEMAEAAALYTFRLPRFYIQNVLRNDPHDPLWDLVIPGAGEFQDAGDERWDAFQLAQRVVNHPRWIQKYRYEALLRLTDYCSGLCRYCYLKNRDVTPGSITHGEIDDIFDQAQRSEHLGDLRELVLSGGDPLAVSAEIVEHFADRVSRLNKQTARRITVTIHTREPVWHPHRILRSQALQEALRKLSPSSYILHVVHPREVTPELHQVLLCLTEIAAVRRPLMMTQHPLFRGINNDPRLIREMYEQLDAGDVIVKPYYLIHPFPDGTLPQHRLTLKESQNILRGLSSAPGTRVPLLTVPTPMGKCFIGPYDSLEDLGGYYLLHTKDGVPVKYTIQALYDPTETRENIPVMPTVNGREK